MCNCSIYKWSYAPNTNMHKHAHTDDEWEDAYRERLAEVDEEEFPKEEEEEEEEDEGDAKERIRGSLVEKFEEQTEAISTVQVYIHSLRSSVVRVCTHGCAPDSQYIMSPFPVTPAQLMRPGYWPKCILCSGWLCITSMYASLFYSRRCGSIDCTCT